MRRLEATVFAASVLAFAAQPALSQQPACDQFAWSIARELTAFSSDRLPSVKSGSEGRALPETGASLQLEPGAKVSFVMPPQRAPKDSNSLAAVSSYVGPERPGTFQVTLSDEAWIDVIQNGQYVASKAFSGKRDCPGVRKTVRFELAAAPFTVQLSDAKASAVKIAILPAE